MDSVLVMHSSPSAVIKPKSIPAEDRGDPVWGSEHNKTSPATDKPNNPSVQGRSTSTESSATCATSLSQSSRMDWAFTSHNENTDRTSDGDEDGAEALTAAIAKKMNLLPEEPHGNHETNKRQSSVEFKEEPAVPEVHQEELEEKPVPTSLQIHKAVPPPSPSTRLRQSTDGALTRSVSFHQVQIRRYPMVAGDNPACQMGAPVTLDWGFEELPALDLDDFESTRSQTRRRKLHHLILNYFQRNRILVGMGYSEEDIKQAEKEVRRERFRRDLTKFTLPISKFEEIFQSVRRKIKRRMNSEAKEEKNELDDSIRMLRSQDSKRMSERKDSD